tara:strand:- start:3789 stop:4163 length:375 start_codon:yes stop_codon:yes gene_type:complete
MHKTKEQLQDRITELETYVTDAENNKKSYAAEVAVLKRDLEDINKPVIKDDVLTQIYEIIQSHVEDINEIDPSDCEFDFELDHDGRVYVDSMQVLKSQDYFSESLYNDLKTLFKVNEEEDEDSV